jgi:hypothetical protein
VVIEVRDRQETDDVTWIDQVQGKWDGAPCTVVAVSSSRFSAKALKKAQRAGIETLTFAGGDDVEWPVVLGTREVVIRRPYVEFTRVECRLAEGSVSPPAGWEFPRHAPFYDVRVYRDRHGSDLSLMDLWQRYVAPCLEPSGEPPGDVKPVVLGVTEEAPIWLVHGDAEARIERFDLIVRYWQEEQRLPLAQARSYTEARTGELRAGIVETTEPLDLGQGLAYVGLVVEPPRDAESHGPTVYVYTRPVEQ